MLSQNYKACIVPGSGGFGRSIGNPLCSEWGSGSHEGQRFGKLGISGCDWGIWKKTQIDLLYWGCVTQHYFDNSFFCGRRPLPFGGSHLRLPSGPAGDSNHHRQSVSAGKTNAIPTEPSGRLQHYFDNSVGQEGLECDSVTLKDVLLPRRQWNAH